MKKFSIEFKWAAIATLAALIWMFIVRAMGYHEVEKIRFEFGFQILFNLILILFYWLGIRQKKKEFYEGVITWQQAVFTGLVMCVLISFFYPLIQYITYYQVSPHFMEMLQEAYVTQTKMSAEEAAKNATFDFFMRESLKNNLSFGVVIVAIISYFIQTKDSDKLKMKATAKPEVVKVKKSKKKIKK